MDTDFTNKIRKLEYSLREEVFTDAVLSSAYSFIALEFATRACQSGDVTQAVMLGAAAVFAGHEARENSHTFASRGPYAPPSYAGAATAGTIVFAADRLNVIQSYFLDLVR